MYYIRGVCGMCVCTHTRTHTHTHTCGIYEDADTYMVVRGHIYKVSMASVRDGHRTHIQYYSTSTRTHIYSTIVLVLGHTYSSRTHIVVSVLMLCIQQYNGSSMCPHTAFMVVRGYIHSSTRTHIQASVREGKDTYIVSHKQYQDTYVVLSVRMLCIQQYTAVVCFLILRIYQYDDTYIAV